MKTNRTFSTIPSLLVYILVITLLLLLPILSLVKETHGILTPYGTTILGSIICFIWLIVRRKV